MSNQDYYGGNNNGAPYGGQQNYNQNQGAPYGGQQSYPQQVRFTCSDSQSFPHHPTITHHQMFSLTNTQPLLPGPVLFW